jgi:hypothetical protein
MPVGVYPLAAIMGVAVSGCAYFCARTLMGPENVFDRKKSPHWEYIQQNQTTKFYNPTGLGYFLNYRPLY